MCCLQTRALMSHSESRYCHSDRIRPAQIIERIQTMPFILPRYLDPLDREILERALEGAVVILSDDKPYDLDSDDELEAELRCELIEIAQSSCITDAETLRDRLLNAWGDCRTCLLSRVKKGTPTEADAPYRDVSRYVDLQ